MWKKDISVTVGDPGFLLAFHVKTTNDFENTVADPRFPKGRDNPRGVRQPIIWHVVAHKAWNEINWTNVGGGRLICVQIIFILVLQSVVDPGLPTGGYEKLLLSYFPKKKTHEN